MKCEISQELVRRLNYETIVIFSVEFVCCLAGFANLSYYQGNSDGSLAAIKAIIWFVIALFNVELGWQYCQKAIKEELGVE